MRILILPGWQDSGPEHWQSLWLKKYPNALKVEQKDWMYPKKDDWVSALQNVVEAQDEEVLLVGHSLGCALIAHWVKENPTSVSRVKGALLVSPFDRFAPEITGFAPMPLDTLPFKSIVVASENDVWASLQEAQTFAQAWQARLVNIGPAGHINGASGFGDWPEGEKLLAELL